MSFSSIPFLFVFFPAAMLLYWIMPRKLKPLIAILLSLVFYAWGDVKHLPVLLFSILFNYLAGLEIGGCRAQGKDRLAKLAAWTSAGANILILCYYKYFAGVLPVGISFFTFSALSYILDVYHGKAEGERNILRVTMYITFFPKLISGPIVQYADFRQQLDTYSITKADAFAGGELFLVSLFKKVLLADNLGKAFAAVQGMTAMSAGTAWLGMIFYSLQLYFDFSGYSDMAIGLARAMGFRIDKNFDYPYRSKNITEFWRRWHISLGAWFRNYVYIPLGGNRCSASRQLFNLAVVWLLTGIWHGSTLNFVFWGLWHGFFVILEKFVIMDRLDRAPDILRILITDLLAFIGWVFFFSPSLGGAFQYLGQMFGAGHMGLWDTTASYYFVHNLILLIAATLFSGPIVRRVQGNLIAQSSTGAAVLSVVVYGVLLVFTIAAMVNATYSSFLYFQF